MTPLPAKYDRPDKKPQAGAVGRHAIPPAALKMVAALGILHLMLMGSTFASLGVVLPHMIPSLDLNWSQAGFGFTLLALAAGLASTMPAWTVRRWSARTTLTLGLIALILAYAAMGVSASAYGYYAGAVLLGIGFSMVGAVPALHVLSAWTPYGRSLVFGIYLAFGGAGSGLWPGFVEAAISSLGGWRNYWWLMVGVAAVVGPICVAIVHDGPQAGAEETAQAETESWTLHEALSSPQFYIIGSAIAFTYLIASTINAFTVSYLTLIGFGTGVAVSIFSIQSVCHAAFPIIMGVLAERIGIKSLLVTGLALQGIGLIALSQGGSLAMLVFFAIGVGGGYGTVYLGTTLVLQNYFGRRHYAAIFGANQLFTTLSVVGPVLVGVAADMTGRFDQSFLGCAAFLFLAAIACFAMRPPSRLQSAFVPAMK
jgi:MFS transporter, OFA family, oxalate/formate antiporter